MRDSAFLEDKGMRQYTFGLLLNATPDLVFSLSLPDQCFCFWNFTVAQLLGWSDIPLRVSGRALIRHLIHTEDHRTILQFLHNLRRVEDGEVVEVEFRVHTSEGKLRWLRCRGMVFSRTLEGSANEVLCTAQDISTHREQALVMENHTAKLQDLMQCLTHQARELECANVRLEALATTDGLTGLLNHGTFQERLEAACSYAKRAESSLALLLLDVDFFKRINDQFGHPIGDAILRRVAVTLTECVRDSDIVARYGGEEFAIVLPDADQDIALQTAGRIHQTLATITNSPTPITVSIGVSLLGYPIFNRERLIESADEALYTAKRTGRNRTCVA